MNFLTRFIRFIARKFEEFKMSRSQHSPWWESLKWDSEVVDVTLWIELPFRMMIDSCDTTVDFEGGSYSITIENSCFEIHASRALDSKASCIYIGQLPPRFNAELAKEITENNIPLFERPCRTVLKVKGKCVSDVFPASNEEGPRGISSRYYLEAFCKAYIPVVNAVIRKYRQGCYDTLAFEVSPWDVPIWRVDWNHNCVQVSINEHLATDGRPEIVRGEITEKLSLITPEQLNAVQPQHWTVAENTLLDAHNLLRRGDYNGAVRRANTAIEVLVDDVLGELLRTSLSEEESMKFMRKNRNHFPNRFEKIEELRGDSMDAHLRQSLWDIRDLRNEIVHAGRYIGFPEAGRARWAVDHARFIFNWIEQNPAKHNEREMPMVRSAMHGGLMGELFRITYTPQGVTINPP